MYTAILLLVALVGVVFGFLVYRVLVRSERFARLIGGAIEPPPETPEEIVNRLRSEKLRATGCAGKCRSAADKARAAADKIDSELRPPRRRRS